MNILQITVFTGIGVTIESYDIMVCSLLAKQLGANFFSAVSPSMQVMLVYAILTVAYLVSPVSSLIVGFLGDLKGRKTVIVNAQVWMTACTFLMGVLPTYQQIGWLAGALLAVLRITQNLVVGGDFPGAVTYLLEHASEKRGLYFGVMMGILGFGSAMASGVVYLLMDWIPTHEFNAWGFRLPFLFGGVLGIVGIMLRRMMPESPEFLRYIAETPPDEPPANLRHVFKKIWRPALLVIGTTLAPLSVSTFKSTMPVMLDSFYHFNAADIYLALSVVYFSSGFLKMFFGWLTDFVGCYKIALASSLLLLLGAIPLFGILRSGLSIAPFVFILYLQAVTALSSSSMSILIAATFPAKIRYAGAGLSNSVGNMFAACILPFAQLNYGFWHTDIGMMGLFIALAVLSIYSLKLLVTRYDLV